MEERSSLPVDLNRAADVTEEVEQTIDQLFGHQTWDDGQRVASAMVRSALADVVKLIIAHVPPCPTRTVAVRKLVEASMDCNRAISFRGGI